MIPTDPDPDERDRAIREKLVSLKGVPSEAPGLCPPPTVWWEIAAGLIGSDRAQSLLGHAASCNRCATELAAGLDEGNESTQSADTLDRPEARKALVSRIAGSRSKSKRWFLIAAVALIGIGAAIFYATPPSTDRLIARAYAEKRTVEFRFPGAPHSELRVERGGGRANRTAPLLEAEAHVLEAMRRSPDSVRLLEQKSQIDLLNWDYDSAIRAAARAAELDSSNVDAALDLALAYFERAEAENRPTDGATAADLLSRLLQKHPANRDALFDRAVVFEYLQMYREAQADWENYLRLDPSGEWSAEARKRLEAVRAKLALHEGGGSKACATLTAGVVVSWHGDFRRIDDWQGGWECLRERALDEWLTESSPALEDVARAFESIGDSWFTDLLASRAQARFHDAAAALSDAVDANLKLDTAGAAKSAEVAAELFRALHNDAGFVQAERERIYASRRVLDAAECRERVNATLPLARDRWRWLRIQLRLELASCLAMPGDYAASSELARAILKESSGPAFVSLHLRALSYLVSSDGSSGDAAAAWQDGEKGLAAYWQGNFQHVWAYQLYYNLAASVATENRYQIAAHLQHEALAEIELSARPLLVAFTWFDYGRTLALAGDLDGAQASLDRASNLFAALPPDRALTVAEAECQAYLAEVETRRGMPERAHARLDGIAASMRGVTTLGPWLRYARISAETDRRLGAMGRYHSRIPLLAELVDLGFESAGGFERREQWLAETDDVLGMLVGEFAAENDARRALDYWEWPRGPGPVHATAIDAARLAHVTESPQLPEVPDAAADLARAGVSQAIVYAPLEDRLLVWQFRRGNVSVRTVDVGKSEIESLARHVYALCSSPDSDPAREADAARQLSRYLIDPLDWTFSNDQPLWIQADGVLAGVPFPVLPLPSGDLLGEHFATSQIPGAGYLTGSAGTSAGPMLAIGISEAAHGLAALPSAVEEARQAAGFFTAPTLLTGAEASADRMRAELPRASIFHFAGHSSNTAARSGLLFADASTLDAGAIAAMHLDRCRLAVISACSGEAPDAGERRLGIATALLAAGVRGAIATRWDLDSAAALAYTRDYYSRFARGEPPVLAAQSAALDLRRRPETSRPYYWAAYQFFGR